MKINKKFKFNKLSTQASLRGTTIGVHSHFHAG